MILVDTSLQVRIDLVSRIIASHCSEAFEKSEANLSKGRIVDSFDSGEKKHEERAGSEEQRRPPKKSQ
jgi:hypothetical protein